jgi:hypothetical protein
LVGRDRLPILVRSTPNTDHKFNALVPVAKCHMETFAWLCDIMPMMRRRTFTFGLGSIALGMPSLCIGQPDLRPLRRGWDFVPSITILFTEEADPRLPLVGDATAFWNNAFSELATQFRLGGLTHVRGAIPVEDLKMLAANVVGTGRPARELPESVRRIKGNIVVALSDGDFISFAARPATGEKALVAIKDHRLFPLTLPNVARNVIAHELGHVIGLPHNDDPTTLMCGRPAPCRPDLFTAEGAKYFPLSDVDNGNLRRMYPPSWRAAH